MNNRLSSSSADAQTGSPRPPPSAADAAAPSLASPRSSSLEDTAPAAAAGTASPSSSPQHSGQEPSVDFVLVFESVPKRFLKPGKVPSNVKAEIAQEYEKLVSRIEDVGLEVTSRDGAVNSGTVLLFVRASDEALVKIGREEGLIDYLHGVRTDCEPAASSLGRSSSLPKGSTHSLAQSQFSSADRIRHLYTLLTLPAKPVTSDGITRRGAGLRVKSDEFPHLIDMTPLHDPAYNRAWLKRWGSSQSFLAISVRDLDGIRSHFGEHIAFYFGFLLYYFQSLAPVAAVGGLFWVAGAPYHPLYSLALVFWACVFVESWRIKERKLAVRWGTLNCGSVESRRLGFKANRVESDKVTGEDVEVFEWWRKELRIACSIPAVLFFAALLASVLTTMFVVEVFVARLYDGPGKAAVPYIPTALFSVCIPQIMAAWQATAASLTGWENHFSQRDYDWAMTVKMFALQGFVAYGALTLSAFIYIPFGQALMDHIVSKGYFARSIADAVSQGTLALRNDGGIQFEINPDRMHSQLFAVLTTSQVINAFMELGLPFVLRKINQWRNGDSNDAKKEKSVPGTPVPTDSERQFLARVASELALPAYDTFGDYAEMATQFGYIVLWSVIWPLAPLGGLVNNFFEMRGDALKICVHARRPVPLRTDSVGPWLEILGFIAWLAAMSNAALLYLFQRSPEAHLPGHSTYEATMRTHLHPGAGLPAVNGSASSLFYSSDPEHSKRSLLSASNILPSFLPTHGAAGAMTGAFLVALASEHGYGIARAAVRHILERVLWKDSAEEVLLKRREWEARRDAVAKVRGPSAAAGDEKLGGAAKRDTSNDGPADVSFWAKERDVGLEAIQSSGKVE
ncbi:unnamed protein product [Parajaminaea phylloscopi]